MHCPPLRQGLESHSLISAKYKHVKVRNCCPSHLIDERPRIARNAKVKNVKVGGGEREKKPPTDPFI